jgi:hypothetical protein
MIRVALPTEGLESYLVGVIGNATGTRIVLEGEPERLRRWLRDAYVQVDAAEDAARE